MRWSYSQILEAAVKPYSLVHLSTSQSGWLLEAAISWTDKPSTAKLAKEVEDRSEALDPVEILRRTAFTNVAADVFRARLTRSTLSLIAAREGIRVRHVN